VALQDREPSRGRWRANGAFGIGVGVGVAGVLIVALLAAGLLVARSAVGGGQLPGNPQGGVAGASGGNGGAGGSDGRLDVPPDVAYGSDAGGSAPISETGTGTGTGAKPASSGASHKPGASSSPTRPSSPSPTHTPSPTPKPTVSPTHAPTAVPTPVPPSYVGYITLKVSHWCYRLDNHATVGPYAVGSRWGVFGVIYANGAWSWEVSPPNLGGVHCASGMNGDTHFDSNTTGIIGTIVLHASHQIYRTDNGALAGPYPAGTTWNVYGTGTAFENGVEAWMIYPSQLGGSVACAEGEVGDIEFDPA
jgi:hypothetical protein